MNEFARLRHKIYLERTGDRCEDHQSMVYGLGLALFGERPQEPVALTLHAAAQLHADSPERILDLVPHAGISRYFDRYLADAIATHPGVIDEARALLADGARSSGKESRQPGLLELISPPDCEPPGAVQPTADGNPEIESVSHPVSIVQCMFYGDPARSGLGSSGGIGTLLTELGSAMSVETGGVVTLVLYDTARSRYRFVPVERLSDNHSIVRVPVPLKEEAPAGFLNGRQVIERAIARGLDQHQLRPDVVHVRFLDDASLAAARASELAGSRLVSTITPDPHRQICDPEGRIRSLPPETGLDYLNKVFIGDELVRRAHGIVAIGSATMERELWPYYPQLEDTRGRVVAGIDEGVRTGGVEAEHDFSEMLVAEPPEHRLTRRFATRPIILCVGRLAPIKNQVALVRAWSRSLFGAYNLVLVGGDLDNPTRDETAMITGIREALDERTDLAGRFCHVPGRPNALVRGLQSYLAKRPHGGSPDVYVCPSLKEEFGLSILEAMASGLVVFAPLRGGAGTYIRHGVNGFLIDTGDDGTLADELETLLTPQLAARAPSIGRNAQDTVLKRFSVERIASEFATYYRRVTRA